MFSNIGLAEGQASTVGVHANVNRNRFEGFVGAEECWQALFPDGSGGMKFRTFQKLIDTNAIPYCKIRGRNYFQVSEVLAAIRKNCLREVVTSY